MTISSTQDSLFLPSLLFDELDQVDTSISGDGVWSILGVPLHALDINDANFLVEAGACFILKKVDGVSVQKQKLLDPNRLAGNHFGSRVWMSSYGRRLFVASKDDSNSIASGGSVFVYDLDETTGVWNLKTKIELATPLSGAKFGWSIMSDFYGQLLMVGSPFEDNGGTLRGAGYLFRDNGITFDQLNKFSYSKATDNSRAGYSVAISGDGNVAFVGMTLADLSGSVGVFKKNNSDIFPSIENSLIRDDNGQADDYFAVAIETLDSVAGNSLVVDHEGRNLYVGAHNKLDSDSGVRGEVFRFTGDTNYDYTFKESIMQRKGKTLDTTTLVSKFGFYLATDKLGKVLVVGAKDDGEVQSGSGAYYIYKKDISFNTYTVKVKQDSPVLDDNEGSSVAISNDGSAIISGSNSLIELPPILNTNNAILALISDEVVLIVGGVYASTIIADGATGYWRLGETSGTNAVDEISGNDGTYAATVVLDNDGLLVGDPDRAAEFNIAASKPKVSILTINTLSGFLDFTIEVWIESYSVGTSRVIYSEDIAGGTIFAVYINAGGFISFDFNAGGLITLNSPTAVVLNGNYYIVVVGDSSGLKLYVNAVELDSDPSTARNVAVITSLQISGVTNAGGILYFDGIIDEVSSYSNKTITPAQISDHYNIGLPGWNLTSATYDSISLSVVSQDNAVNGMFIRPDGTKGYMIGSQFNRIYQYDLPTPHSWSGSSYDSTVIGLSALTGNTSPTGMFWSPDGEDLYVVNFGSKRIEHITLSVGWGFSSTLNFFSSIIIGSVSPGPIGVFFKDDGTKMYVADITNSAIYQYSVPAFPSLVGATYDSISLDVSSETTVLTDLFITPNGKELFICEQSASNSVIQYDLPLAWSLEGGAPSGDSFSLNPEGSGPNGVFFKSDGLAMYTADNVNDAIKQYTLAE